MLFVHGISGTPRTFARLCAGLDHERYQPWLYYYPSGAHLDAIADHLASVIEKLRLRYGFTVLPVVAYSMGGLVARAFILRHANGIARRVPLLVTIASPFGGIPAAGLGVEHAPAVVRSWRDVAPQSSFLDGLFYDGDGTSRVRRRLPTHVTYHLLFAYRRRAKLPGPSGDGVATLASQLRPEAQEEAATVRGFDHTHTGAIDAPEVAALVNLLLAGTAR